MLSKRFEASLLQICANNIDSDGIHAFGTKIIAAVLNAVTGFFKNPQRICQLVLHIGKQLIGHLFFHAGVEKGSRVPALPWDAPRPA